MGENMSMSQVRALIAEVDEDKSGEIEWEEYLLVMGKRKDEASRKGTGLFQKWSKRVKEVAESKAAQLQAAHAEREARLALGDEERAAAVERAAKAAALEKEMIAKRNDETRVAALKRQLDIDEAKEKEILARDQAIREKAAAGRERAMREKEAVFKEAAVKAEKTRKASVVAMKRRQSNIEAAEAERVKAELERQKKREANAKRAQVSLCQAFDIFGVVNELYMYFFALISILTNVHGNSNSSLSSG